MARWVLSVLERMFYSSFMDERLFDVGGRQPQVVLGLPVTEGGKARARERLADADRRMTARRWKALRARLGRTRDARSAA